MERGMVMNKIPRIHLGAAHLDRVGEAAEAVVVVGGEEEGVPVVVKAAVGEEGERAKVVEDIRMLLGRGDMIKRCLGWGRYRLEARLGQFYIHYIRSFQHHHYMQYHQIYRCTSVDQRAVLI